MAAWPSSLVLAGTGAACCCAAAARPTPSPHSSSPSPTSGEDAELAAGPAAEVRTHDSAVVDYCLERLAATDDGGVATLDSQPAPGVRILPLRAGGPFTPWERTYEADPDGQGPRGAAEWYVPWAEGETEAGVARGRLLFLHGGGYTW